MEISPATQEVKKKSKRLRYFAWVAAGVALASLVTDAAVGNTTTVYKRVVVYRNTPTKPTAKPTIPSTTITPPSPSTTKTESKKTVTKTQSFIAEVSCSNIIPEGNIVNIPASKSTDGAYIDNKVEVNNILICPTGSSAVPAEIKTPETITKIKHGSVYTTSTRQSKSVDVSVNVSANLFIDPMAAPNEIGDISHLKLGESEERYNKLSSTLINTGRGSLRSEPEMNSRFTSNQSPSTLRYMTAYIATDGQIASELDADFRLALNMPSVAAGLSIVNNETTIDLRKSFPKAKEINVNISQMNPYQAVDQVIANNKTSLELFKHFEYRNTAEGITQQIAVSTIGARSIVEDNTAPLTQSQDDLIDSQLKAAGYN